MSQVGTCDNCGAKIEIEDSDELLPPAEGQFYQDENLPQHSLCENCRQALQNHDGN